jgi:hypothetical protein
MMEGPCADSEEKQEPVSDIDTVMVDSLKVLDPRRPIREADIRQPLNFAPPRCINPCADLDLRIAGGRGARGRLSDLPVGLS